MTPPEPRPQEPNVQWLVCGMSDCAFAVERGEGRTMALHQGKAHAVPDPTPPTALRAALEALWREYLERHDQSLPEFGPNSGENGRWKARAEGVDAAIETIRSLTPAAEAGPGPGLDVWDAVNHLRDSDPDGYLRLARAVATDVVTNPEFRADALREPRS